MGLVHGKRLPRAVRGYFTVEAALVMPVVLLCYAVVVILLCFIYERCIWEQNACRLPIWKEYVEGFVYVDPQMEQQISKDEICQYMLECMNSEESNKYLLGQDIYIKISDRGGRIRVDRNITYARMNDKCYEYTAEVMSFEPVSYLRITKQLKSAERKNDDQE